MRSVAPEEEVLSREELDALLEEMPKLLAEREADLETDRPQIADIDLQRANESFAFEYGLVLSNRHQRVIGFSLIGQREIEMRELAELMLPTDLAAAFRLVPQDVGGYLLLSRPLFFQLLSMSFGSGPTIKPSRPPTREYSRIERRFYVRAAMEMFEQFAQAWSQVSPTQVVSEGLVSRASVAESRDGHALLATFDVRGFGEACRVRVAIPGSAFTLEEGAQGRSASPVRRAPGVLLDQVPIRLRARIGTADLTLAEVGRLAPGDLIPLDAASDGSLTILIGRQEKFRGTAGAQGARRAVRLEDRISRSE